MDAPTPPGAAAATGTARRSASDTSTEGMPDFRALFEAAPGLCLVLRADDTPRFTIVAASDAYLQATLTSREGPSGIIGRGLFEVFPDPPDDPHATGERNLRASLERAKSTGAPDAMPVQRYAICRPDGTWEERFWLPLNTPVVDQGSGRVTHLLHQVEDVTAAVQLAAEHDRLRGAHAESERGRREAEDANAALARERAALEEANLQLQNQALELELQAEELQGSTTELGARTEEAEALAGQLRVSEAHARAVFVHAAVGMGRVAFDDARWLEVNDAFCRMLGYTREELLATPWPAITHPDDLDLDLIPFRRMAAGELETYAIEKRFLHKLGHHVWARLTLSLVRTAAGQPGYEIAVIEDITARKAADAERERLLGALDVERARLSDVLRQAPVAVAVVRGRTVDELVYELANPRYQEAVAPGLDTLGRRVRDVLPALEDGHAAVLQGVLDTGDPFVANDYRVPLDRDGDGVLEDHYFSFVYHPLVGGDGAVAGLIAVGTEVTESVQARQEAEAARARTDAVLASIADAFYLLDRDWRFTYVNDAAEPLLQTTREELLGRSLWDAFPGVAGSVFEGPYRDAMATGRPTSVEAYFEPLATWFDVRSYPWTGGLMVHFRDISARRTAEAERERLLADAQAARTEAETARAEEEAARARAEGASRAKSEFLAVMSHELRTPLNAIGGYAELMELGIRGPVTELQRDDLARIQRSQRALLGLINEVLNYARLEAGAVHYDLTQVPIAEAVGAAEMLVSPQLRAKGLGYTWAGGDPGLMVRADRDKLQQILLNLLTNAIKFTNVRAGLPGRVDVSCEDGGDAIRIRVHDTGVGIPADKLGVIFEPFVQVDARLTRQHEGVGLGLAISRDLARGMGGELTVESTLGDGTTFTLTLPAAR